uniref:Uncharacterized protein n=1 Tax=Arundo donax TaxID=35708 RepID=A0A0A9C0N4_ARUDO
MAFPTTDLRMKGFFLDLVFLDTTICYRGKWRS